MNRPQPNCAVALVILAAIIVLGVALSGGLWVILMQSLGEW